MRLALLVILTLLLYSASHVCTYFPRWWLPSFLRWCSMPASFAAMRAMHGGFLEFSLLLQTAVLSCWLFDFFFLHWLTINFSKVLLYLSLTTKRSELDGSQTVHVHLFRPCHVKLQRAIETLGGNDFKRYHFWQFAVKRTHVRTKQQWQYVLKLNSIPKPSSGPLGTDKRGVLHRTHAVKLKSQKR